MTKGIFFVIIIVMKKQGKKIVDDVMVAQSQQSFLPEENVDEKTEENIAQNEPELIVEKNEESKELVAEEISKEEHELKSDTSLQKQKLDEYEQTVSKNKSKKNKIVNLIFFFVNIAVVAGILVYQISKEPLVPLTGFRLDWASLIACLAFFGIVVASEALSISYLLKVSTGKWRLGISYKTAEIGRYYDSVTPMATGGQPFQITYLKNRGVPLHTSLSIPLAKYVFTQISSTILSLICLIISSVDKSYGTFVSVMSIIGFVLSTVVLAATLFLCICKTVGKKIVVKVLKLLYKMKIIKNYDKQYEKITKYISDFQDVMKQYAKSPKDFIIMMTLCCIRQIANYSMPFFIVKLFVPGLEGGMFIKLLVMSVLVDLASSFFPMPGGTGLNEISFSAAFASVVNVEGVLVWVLLLWRFFSYYVYLLQGVCILSYDIAYGNRKYRWQVTKENLAEESKVFKQAQIDKFRNERTKRRKGKQKTALNKVRIE